MTVLALLIGLLIGGIVFYFYSKKTQQTNNKVNADLVLENIRTACKIISVEGDFTDIYNHKDKKGVFFNVFTSKKQTLIIIKATAYVGFDLRKINLQVDPDKKLIYIGNIPEPEVLNIETDANFYDITESTLNKFSAEELTTILNAAKENITEQVTKSKLITLAKQQGLDFLQVIQLIAKSSGYAIEIENNKNLTKAESLNPTINISSNT